MREELRKINPKPTAVFVASLKSGRYSHMAVQRLLNKNYPVYPLGFEAGKIGNARVITDFPIIDSLHTLTLYLNPQRQKQHYSYMLSLKPKRIIFNPGAENIEFQQIAEAEGIQTLNACTLVLLSTDQY